MGNVVSAITSDITSTVQAVVKGITDVGAAATSLKEVTAGLLTPVQASQNQAGFKTSAYILSSDSPDDIGSALTGAMNAVKQAAAKQFLATFPSSTAAGLDNGVVQAYVSGGKVDCVTKQIALDFSNWEISADSTTAANMANTIAMEIANQNGGPGMAQGHHSLNASQVINWAVAYGMFVTGNNTQGLVYAFTASFDTNF